MLQNAHVYPTIAVKSLDTARKFYEDELGLEAVKESPAGITYKVGSDRLFVYVSQYGGTNQGTSANFEVTDVYAAVDYLKDKGVLFEHYTNMPDVTLDGDVHIMGPMMAAWFKDPDGNILCVNNAV